MASVPWINQKSSYEEAIEYMKKRRSGEITSLKTPYKQLNYATLDGIEWQNMMIIAGRPATGKTAVKDQIIREAFTLNPNTKMSVLEFNLEMVGKVTALRSFSSFLGKTYSELLSTRGNKLSDEILLQCERYSQNMLKHSIFTVEEPPSVPKFEKIVTDYMRHRKYMKNGKMVYENVIITVDHSILLLKSGRQSVNDMLYELGAAITRLKRKYPIIFIILSQLNRSIDNPERNEDGKYGNYVLESDIFGADALLQHADLAIGLNRPAKQKIRLYGPEKYIVENEQLLVMHHIKARQGDVGLAFYNVDFSKMSIVDRSKPEKQTGRY